MLSIWYSSAVFSKTKSAMRRSISSPPSHMFPPLPCSIKPPPLMVRAERSRVPPPKSNIRTVFASSPLTVSTPKEMAAAVGSGSSRCTFNPARKAAVLVACFCLSLKYDGTVITAQSTPSSRAFSASRRIFFSISADISSGVYSLPPRTTARLFSDPLK